MKKCLKCNVNVNTVRKTCPLCGQILNDESESTSELLYPKYVHKEKHINIVLRILLFLSVTAIAVSLVVNIMTYKDSMWSIYIIIGVGYAWILLRSTIMSRRNIAGRLLIQVMALSLLVVIVEKVSKSDGWALEYVVPFICILNTLAILVILINKQMRYNDYLLYLLAAILISFVPMILYWTEVVQVLWPSISAAGVAFLTIAGMIIFADRATKDELMKRFHL